MSLTREDESEAIRIWALLGARAGDNDQIIALAEAIGLPVEIKQLEYNGWRHLGPRLLGASLRSLTRSSRRMLLEEPLPDLTISAGHRSVAVVRALRRRSSGRTRSIHVGFPRVSPAHFDLVIATPQYPMRDHPNLLRLPFALTRAASAATRESDAGELRDLPAPRRLLIIGGPTIYWRIDEEGLLATISAMLDEARFEGGAVMVTTSPRTPEQLRSKVSEMLAKADVPTVLAEPGKPPAYRNLLASADSIRVTADSVAMLSDAIWSRKPVAMVPVEKSALGRMAMAIAGWVTPAGLLYPQDLRCFWLALERVGITQRLASPHASTEAVLREVIASIRPIVEKVE